MEQWEKDRRAELEKELSDGYYNISGGSFVVGTGKQGYIDFQILLEKEFRSYGTSVLNADKTDVDELKAMAPKEYQLLSEEELITMLTNLNSIKGKDE